MGKRDYIPAFFKYRETLAGLNDAEVGRVFRAALDYGADGTLPSLSPVEAMAFGFIRTDIDAAARAYDERCEANRENARKRWDSDGMRTDAKVCESMRTDAKHANTIQYNTRQDNTTGGDTRARTRGNGKQSGKRLTVGGPDAAGTGTTHRDEPVPPTVDDINAYCREAGLMHVDPRRFFDNYAAAGWMRNGEPIRDWKALCRKWDAEDAEKAAHAAPKSQKSQETSFDTDEFFEAALARSYADYNTGENAEK